MKQDAPERLNLPDSSSESDGFDVLEAAIQGILGEEEIFMAPFIPTDDQPIVYVPPPPPPTPPTSRPSPEVQNLVQNEPPQQEQERSSNDTCRTITALPNTCYNHKSPRQQPTYGSRALTSSK